MDHIDGHPDGERWRVKITHCGDRNKRLVIPLAWFERHKMSMEKLFVDIKGDSFVIRPSGEPDKNAAGWFERKIMKPKGEEKQITIPNIWLEGQKEKYGVKIKEFDIYEKGNRLIVKPVVSEYVKTHRKISSFSNEIKTVENLCAVKIIRRTQQNGKVFESISLPRNWIKMQMALTNKKINSIMLDIRSDAIVIRIKGTPADDNVAGSVKRKIRRIGNYKHTVIIPDIWVDAQKHKFGVNVKELLIEQKECGLLIRPARPKNTRVLRENPSIFNDPKRAPRQTNDWFY